MLGFIVDSRLKFLINIWCLHFVQCTSSSTSWRTIFLGSDGMFLRLHVPILYIVDRYPRLGLYCLPGQKTFISWLSPQRQEYPHELIFRGEKLGHVRDDAQGEIVTLDYETCH